MGLRYTRMKVFHFKEKLDSLPRSVAKVLAPIHVRIKPTNVCNHNCRYCAYRVDDLQLGQDMDVRDSIPREKMLEIVSDIAEMGVRAVTFSGGGDPFCYQHLQAAGAALAKTPVQFAALTNGSRLEGELAALFSRHATWLRVSMDGWDDESYASYRGVKAGEFGKVVGNMRRFQALGGRCYLGVSLIVDSQNVAHIRDFTSRMKDIGVDSVKISPCIVSNQGARNNAYHKEIFALAREQIGLAKALEGPGFEVCDSYHALDEKFAKRYTWCPYLQILPVIGADQNVYPCQDKAYNLAEGLIGSIRDRRFKDFWFDGKDKFFKTDPSRLCDHHCVANEKNRLIHEYLDADGEHLPFV